MAPCVSNGNECLREGGQNNLCLELCERVTLYSFKVPMRQEVSNSLKMLAQRSCSTTLIMKCGSFVFGPSSLYLNPAFVISLTHMLRRKYLSWDFGARVESFWTIQICFRSVSPL